MMQVFFYTMAKRTAKNFKRNAGLTMPQKSTRTAYIRGFIKNFELTLDLSNIRRAFDNRCNVGDATYTSIPATANISAFESASETVSVVRDHEEYRLRVRLMGRDTQVFYLTPGFFDKARLIRTSNILDYVDGIELKNDDKKSIKLPFAGSSLEVKVEASLLPENVYNARAYQK